MWAGVAGNPVNNNTGYEIVVSIHDSVYNTDFASIVVPYEAGQIEKNARIIREHVIKTIRQFSSEHLCKFLGAGVTLTLLREVNTATSSMCETRAQKILVPQSLHTSVA